MKKLRSRPDSTDIFTVSVGRDLVPLCPEKREAGKNTGRA
jgi:hypothetical protein